MFHLYERDEMEDLFPDEVIVSYMKTKRKKFLKRALSDEYISKRVQTLIPHIGESVKHENLLNNLYVSFSPKEFTEIIAPFEEGEFEIIGLPSWIRKV